MAAPNPTALSNVTRFRPNHLRSSSRSPSRSPVRKSLFIARELDPLLSNLSPDSTLKALQSTHTITKDGAGQDALTSSIAEASPEEREVGIRAAVAAHKLKEWRHEVDQWPWAHRRDRGWGAGFLPPTRQRRQSQGNSDTAEQHGYIPTESIQIYQDRIEDIRDGIEALGLEDIKDHVFSAHIPSRTASTATSTTSDEVPTPTRSAYGRMKDFTALITATVIQALPELANLNILLDTWDIRLSVLRRIPDIRRSQKSATAAISTAFMIVRDPATGPLVTFEEFEQTKSILGNKVASLGSKIDKLLDLLEGQEDSIPKEWIDSLESIENEYASWVVEAEHVAIRNDLLSKIVWSEKPDPHPSKSGVRKVTMSSAPPTVLEAPVSTYQEPILTDQWSTTTADLVHPPTHAAPPTAEAVQQQAPAISQWSPMVYDQPLALQQEPVALQQEPIALQQKASVPLQAPIATHEDLPAVQQDTLTARQHSSIDTTHPQADLRTHRISPDIRDDVSGIATPVAELPVPGTFDNASNKRSRGASTSSANHVLSTNAGPAHAHRRELSQMSAMSAMSGMSDLSQAEIVDARSTQLLTSPKISVIENPRGSRDELSFLTSGNGTDTNLPVRPPMLQRASTTSIEVVPNEKLRRLTLNKSRSLDMLGQVAQSPPSTPKKALRQLTGADSMQSSPTKSVSDEAGLLAAQRQDPYNTSPTRSSAMAPEVVKSDARVHPDGQKHLVPDLPRRSSKRQTGQVSPEVAPLPPARLQTQLEGDESLDSLLLQDPLQGSPRKSASPRKIRKEENLEDKIEDILTTMPTKIRLARDPDVIENSSSSLSLGGSTTSATPMPALTLSPAKGDRLNRHAAPGDVRVFHLTQSGQSRDTPPVKLFVRAVGENGERVMVRVGGGWADLGEYLKEYSLHHGHRGINAGNLEVANFPGGSPVAAGIESPAVSSLTPSAPISRASTGSVDTPSKMRNSGAGLSLGTLPTLAVSKPRRGNRLQAFEPRGVNADSEWTPPPVPPIPNSFTYHSPTITTTTVNGRTTTKVIDAPTPVVMSGSRVTSTPVQISATNSQSSVPTVNSTASAPHDGSRYTPLGAAGPKGNTRRAVTYNMTTSADSGAWVQDMVGKARAVSNSTTIHSPTVTSTVAISSLPSGNRRKSMLGGLSPAHKSRTPSPAATPREDGALGQPKNRMSLGDVGSIRRVFLRRKSEK